MLQYIQSSNRVPYCFFYTKPFYEVDNPYRPSYNESVRETVEKRTHTKIYEENFACAIRVIQYSGTFKIFVP